MMLNKVLISFVPVIDEFDEHQVVERDRPTDYDQPVAGQRSTARRWRRHRRFRRFLDGLRDR
jgi:hypothetical protein